MAPDGPVLQVRGLDKSFGALRVAQQVNLDLHAGARVGLIGPNGAGKTTLVNLLTGTIRPDAGAITLAGERIEGLKPEARVHRGLVRTHQINALLTETSVLDNVAIAVAERDHEAWRMFRYGPQWRRCREEAAGFLADVGLGDVAGHVVRALPYGRQRLLEIAILIIEHDMDLVFRFAAEIVVLVQGAILRRGAPAGIAADPEVRAVYLGRSGA